MKISKTAWAAALAWAALISAAGRAEPAAAWLAIGTIALAPLALAIICGSVTARPGAIRAVDAEALAWAQPDRGASSARRGRGLGARVRSPAQPLSA